MMEYISMQLAERMCKSNVINEDDVSAQRF